MVWRLEACAACSRKHCGQGLERWVQADTGMAGSYNRIVRRRLDLSRHFPHAGMPPSFAFPQMSRPTA